MGRSAARILVFVTLALGMTACRGSATPATAIANPPTSSAAAIGTAGDTAPVNPPGPTEAPRRASTTPDLSATPLLPTGCDEAIIRGVVADFIAAFNRGDQAGLARVFPAKGSDGDHPWTGDPNQLRWFTLVRANPSKGIDALNLYTRDTLLAYFAERYAQHEQMDLAELVINPAGGGPGVAAINFRITRAADDLPERTFFGKGGVSCAHNVLFLWSQGAPLDNASATPSLP